MHASERYDTVQDRLRDASDELDAAREKYVWVAHTHIHSAILSTYVCMYVYVCVCVC